MKSVLHSTKCFVSYPPDAQEADHNEGARWLCHAFERRYGNNYRIFNLSGFTKELHLSSQVPVIDLFWPVPLAPGLEQLVTAIDQLDFWLHNHDNGYQYGMGQDGTNVDPAINRVAVLHCTGPRSLLATYLAVYICQSKARFGPLCGQRPGSPTARGLQWNERRFRRFRNELVLEHMILKRFYEDNLARELSPSQKRSVAYVFNVFTCMPMPFHSSCSVCLTMF
ncbi:putative tensin [Fasciola hepatica]|uniref:Tensin n=1 Tax=Fasciola hepatica TaxID=6192 RepID=A0A4E0RI46_FASHE|nr:putative tensin [Fasciola hepatica]